MPSPFAVQSLQLTEDWEERMLETDRSTSHRDLAHPLWKIKSKCEERPGTQLLQAAPGGGVGFSPTRTPFWLTHVHSLD